MNDIGFARGPDGEVFPPPLVSGVGPEEALALLEQDAKMNGNRITHVPKRGQSRQGMYNLAMLYVHQRNLKRALAGQLMDDADGRALYESIVEQGDPLSLRPIGMEALHFSTFAPVFRRIEEHRWRVGLPDRGRTALIAGEAGEALERAWAMYIEWCQDESERFVAAVDGLLKTGNVDQGLNHECWGFLLRRGQVDIAHGVSVERMGKHSIYRLTTPRGQRIFKAGSPERATRIAEAIARQAKANLRYPTAQEALGVLTTATGIPTPVQTGTTWIIGEAEARWEGSGNRLVSRLVVIARDDSRYALLRRRGTVVLVRRAGSSRKKTTLAQTALAPNVVRWLQQDTGRLVFLVWAVSRIEQAQAKEHRNVRG